jgi:hypothetical protein
LNVLQWKTSEAKESEMKKEKLHEIIDMDDDVDQVG